MRVRYGEHLRYTSDSMDRGVKSGVFRKVVKRHANDSRVKISSHKKVKAFGSRRGIYKVVSSMYVDHHKCRIAAIGRVT